MTMQPEAIAVVHRSTLLTGAPDAIIERVAGCLHPVELAAGEPVVRKGEHGDAAFFVTAGRLRVHDEALVFNTLGPGDVFGELSALDGSVRSASITADTPARVLRLDRKDLDEIIAGEPAAAAAVIQGLCGLLRLRVSDIHDDREQIQGLERELEIGRTIQASFLPTGIPEIPDWKVIADLEPAREVAGDFYDAFELPGGGQVMLVVGDVCGKGVGAALFMALFRTLVHVAAGGGGEHSASLASDEKDAAEFLTGIARLVNNYVATVHARAGMFTTLVMAVLDPATGRLVYVNAGHEPPLVVNSRAVRLSLEATGPVIGLFAGAEYGAAEAELVSGDLLFCYTDGVTEARASDGSFLGEERMVEVLTGEGIDVDTVLAAIKEATTAHAAGAPQSDDMTVLVAAPAATWAARRAGTAD